MDTTRYKLFQEQLRQSQKMEALGLLAAGIAHDFGNAVTAILGWAEMGLKEVPPDAPVRKRLEKIRDQARHAAGLARQLAGLASQKISEPRKTNLNQAVTTTVSLLENVIGVQIEVKTALAPGLWEVWADPVYLERMVMNLCLNAGDAMPHGGRLLIETRNVDFDADDHDEPVKAREGHHVLLSVSDAGVGMNCTTIKRIFEPFYTTKAPGAGGGLGLMVIYGIVMQYDGCIYVISEAGRGTNFRVYIPLREGPAEQ